MIPNDIKDKILDASRLEDFVPNLTKSGKDLKTDCPFCNKKGKLSVNPVKQIYKCFSCDAGGKGAITYLMATANIDYPEALKLVADRYAIPIETEAERKKRVRKTKKATFFDKQLKESGLTVPDIKTRVYDNDSDTERELIPFKSGTRDQYGRFLPGTGDDMLIYYYDLDGKPVMYKRKNKEKFEHFIRVRWQNPALHTDKEGKPKKYESPYGSTGSHIYIPNAVREMYRYGRPIKRLFIQEGEKKAEKACKHGVLSIGVMGIQNIGHGNQLPEDLQLLIAKCEVKEVVFILDSDWNRLGSKLQNGDRVDLRPLSFFYAVKNFKEYMRTLINIGISVEIYFAHVLPTEKDDKGIDDLLTNTLRGKESELTDDIEKASNEKNGEGQYIRMNKITQISDARLADFWLLNDAEKFADYHKEQIEHLAEFQIGKLKRRFNENGKLVMAQPLMPDEIYWEENFRESRSGGRMELNFDYTNCFNFLKNRGFGRFRTKAGDWEFIHIENMVIRTLTQYDIKDFVTEFTKELKRKDVLNMLYRGGPQYLGYEKLSNLDYMYPTIERATKEQQYLFFKKETWKVTASGIEKNSYTQMVSCVWQEKIHNVDVTRTEPLVNIERITEASKKKYNSPDLIDGEFLIQVTETGKKCEFMQFLINTSKMYWKKERDGEELSIEERLEEHRHLLNKLTAIGYLLHDYKNDSELKLVLGMDGKLSEVGASNGRSGKSLVGVALEHVIPQVYIGGKSKKLTEDNFLFGEVTERTKNIFIDDVRANIDFEHFFPAISGKLKVNPKGGAPFTLSQQDTPKIYMTTNHAINGDGSSFKDRQAYTVFSDFYNDNHKPIDDFGRNFFSEWDTEQWSLFYNLMATCLQLYFKTIDQGWSGKNQGIVPPPLEGVEQRRLRQQMGEDFLAWADAFFSPDPDGLIQNLNKKLKRKEELFDDFIDKNRNAVKYVNATGFGRRIKFYCTYRNLHLNPHKYNAEGIGFTEWIKAFPGKSFIGEADKSGGTEYFTVTEYNWIPEANF